MKASKKATPKPVPQVSTTDFETLLKTLQAYGVTRYKSGEFEVELALHHEPLKPTDKDLSKPAKTKDQIAEEELFHSAVR